MPPPPAPILRDLPDELYGPRVTLRPLRPGDGAALWEAVDESRAQIGAWLPWVSKTLKPEDSEATARRGAARWLTREDLMVGVWDRASGACLGGSGLHHIDWSVPSFEIGYWLRTSAWGQGYITETVQVLCQFAFETLGANRVAIRCDAKNDRSLAVPRRLGFIQEATLRRDERGALRDTVIFALTPEDYASAKADWDRKETSQ
ncbi:MAG: GCN5-related N-acetyltransferase [Capsulimonas sp.]|nr:GCN5-related N-acetyltransferase [Capsulimonas sp.]